MRRRPISLFLCVHLGAFAVACFAVSKFSTDLSNELKEQAKGHVEALLKAPALLRDDSQRLLDAWAREHKTNFKFASALGGLQNAEPKSSN
jgi:hypothetical protein